MLAVNLVGPETLSEEIAPRWELPYIPFFLLPSVPTYLCKTLPKTDS